NNTDSAVQVVGMLSFFTGAVNPSSTNQVVFNAWSVGAPTTYSSTISYSGFPNTVLASVSVPFTSLEVPSSTVYDDTAIGYNVSYFTTPTAYLNTSFFVGCTLSYTWGSTAGDTLGLWITDFQPQPEYTASGG